MFVAQLRKVPWYGILAKRMTTPGIWQMHGLAWLGRVDFARWIEEKIGEHVVDGFQPGRMKAAQPGHLNGRRLARKDEQAVAAGVQREIDKDVDLIAADLVGELLIRQLRSGAPFPCQGAKLLGHGVRSCGVRVTDGRKGLAVVLLKDGEE